MIKKIFIIILLLFTSVSLYASNYGVIYKGNNIGKLESFDTLEQGYLVAKIDNFLALAANNFNEYLVFHSEDFKPQIENANYKVDKKKITTIILASIKKPRYAEEIIGDNKKVIMTCTDDRCRWFYNKNNKTRSKGYISFDGDTIKEFKNITDDISFVKIND